MVPNTNWAKILGISELDLAKHQQEIKDGTPLAYHLLLHKKIDEEKYLRWARNEYGLASLDRAYFLNPHDAELWYAMKVEYQWSPWFVPLKIWDNTLFIGCVEPPKVPIHISLPVHYVLCPAAGLERVWKFYLGDMGVDVTIKSKLTTVTAPQPSPQPVFAREPAPIIPELAPEPTAIISEPPAPEPTIVMPEPQVQKPTFVIADAALQPEESKAPPAELGSMDFARLVIASGKTVPKAKEHKPVTTSDGVLDFSNLKINRPEAEPDTKPAVSAQPAPTFSHPKPTPAQAPVPQRPPSPPPPPPIPTSASAPTPSPIIPAPALTPNPMPTATASMPTVSFPGGKSPAGSVNVAIVPPSIDMVKNLEELVAYTFKEMSVYYDKCLLATYDGGKLIVNRWTQSVTPNPQLATQSLIIDRPNVFKIAHDTKKPYHGPVSSNEVNKAFFDIWNNGQIPATLTIYPLSDGKALMGHLIGIGTKELDVYVVLEFMEKLAQAFTNKTSSMAA